MSSPLVIVLVVVAAALLAWFLRSVNTGASSESAPRDADTLDDASALDDSPGDEGEELQVAVTSEGEILIPFGHGLRVVALEERERLPSERGDIEAGTMTLDPEERSALARVRGGSLLRAGDLTAARMGRGAAEGPPWRVETLGRDGDYGFMGFESEAGARTALELLEKTGIVRRPVDDDGRPIPHSTEDFEEARRRYEETERELALGIDPDDPEPRPDWSSRR